MLSEGKFRPRIEFDASLSGSLRSVPNEGVSSSVGTEVHVCEDASFAKAPPGVAFSFSSKKVVPVFPIFAFDDAASASSSSCAFRARPAALTNMSPGCGVFGRDAAREDPTPRTTVFSKCENASIISRSVSSTPGGGGGTASNPPFSRAATRAAAAGPSLCTPIVRSARASCTSRTNLTPPRSTKKMSSVSSPCLNTTAPRLYSRVVNTYAADRIMLIGTPANAGSACRKLIFSASCSSVTAPKIRL